MSSERFVSKSPDFKPFRFAVYWVSAEESLDEAQISLESVEDWIARGGGFVQGSSVGLMPDVDVVPDSPLDLDLRSVRSGK